MSYNANNVTDVMHIAPRKFQYAFNNTVFSFMHTASGQSLFLNSKFTLVVPTDAQIVFIYPAPDIPRPNSLGEYTNSSSFSWYSGEPLYRFSFVYTITETPQQEILRYFTYLYDNYSAVIYAIAGLVAVLILAYIYVKVIR